MVKRVFIVADHGLAITYFLQSGVIPTLLEVGVEVVLLTDDKVTEKIASLYPHKGLTVEGLSLDKARSYATNFKPSLQYWLDFLRRAGASNKINLEAVDSYISQVETESLQRRRQVLFLFMKFLVSVLRNFRIARKLLVHLQRNFNPNLYSDLFEKYKPALVIASSPGWRWDRYLLREAASRGFQTASVIVGWDNPSSYSLPGANIKWITCWSEIQKTELILGSDWLPEQIHIGGIPSYDGYFNHRWLMSKSDYFELHNLDPNRKLISYACSFITFSPNIQNVEALAQMINSDSLLKPSQLLIRLHPNHFLEVERFEAEREKIRELARDFPFIHVVEPLPLGGDLGHYSGEDMPEKTSMLAHSDVFVTVYSTMVVEAAVHSCPIISACIDSPVGWPDNFTLPLSQIGNWPTHSRFRESGSGKVAYTESELLESINYYIKNPQAHINNQRNFIARECTYTDASAGRRTAEILLSHIQDE